MGVVVGGTRPCTSSPSFSTVLLGHPTSRSIEPRPRQTAFMVSGTVLPEWAGSFQTDVTLLHLQFNACILLN